MRFISILAVLLVGLASFTSIGLIMQHNNRLLYDKVADSMSQSAADIEASLNHIKTLSGLIITDAQLQEQPNFDIIINHGIIPAVNGIIIVPSRMANSLFFPGKSYVANA